MTENKYALGRDLESLTDVERQAHMERVCQYAELDPALGLIRYTRMPKNDGSGDLHLVLYATKGATNSIRENKGIDITSLTDKVVAGAYVVTAGAKNAKNRTDFATGACTIEGKKGKSLENAFALAQTRATRRVTLQMSGLDLLDESEIFDVDKSVAAVENPPAVPEVATSTPSTEPGVDITVPAGLTLKVSTTSLATTSAPPPPAAEERVPNPAAGLKLAVTNMSGPSGQARGVAVPAPAEPVAALPAIEHPTVSESTQSMEEAPKRRRRRTKAEMEAARSAEPAEDRKTIVTDPGTPESLAYAKEATEAAMNDQPIPKPPITLGDVPTPEQMTKYVARLKQYREVILPEGGLVPSNGLGPNRKIRMFFSVANNNIGADNLGKLTNAQWENTFRYMDSVVASKGSKELVAIIELNIAEVPSESVAASA